MANKKVILRLPKVLESLGLDYWRDGVLEYWSVEKRDHSFDHYSTTPVLQCSKVNLS